MEGRSDGRLGQLELVVGASRTITKAEEEVLLAATERADTPKRLWLYLHFECHLPQRAHRTALSGKAGNIERPFLIEVGSFDVDNFGKENVSRLRGFQHTQVASIDLGYRHGKTIMGALLYLLTVSVQRDGVRLGGSLRYRYFLAAERIALSGRQYGLSAGGGIVLRQLIGSHFERHFDRCVGLGARRYGDTHARLTIYQELNVLRSKRSREVNSVTKFGFLLATDEAEQ